MLQSPQILSAEKEAAHQYQQAITNLRCSIDMNAEVSELELWHQTMKTAAEELATRLGTSWSWGTAL